jgi:hypothetical protein
MAGGIAGVADGLEGSREKTATARTDPIYGLHPSKSWKAKHQPVRRKSDPEKLAIAARLRTETILSIRRIAVRLHLSCAKSA